MKVLTWPRLAAGPIAILALSLSCADEDEPTAEEITPEEAPTAASPIVDAQLLTGEERALVEEAIASDPRVKEIIGDREYRIENISPWLDGGEKFAGVAYLLWDEPLTVTYEWPTASYRNHYEYYGPELGLRPYRESVSEFTVYGLTGLEVRVDLQEQRVIGIELSPLGPSGSEAYERIESPEGLEVDLSDEERQQVLDISLSDERVRDILSGRDYRIINVVALAFDGRRLAGVIVQWDDREDIEADWPLLIDLDWETGEYQVHTAHFTAETVGRLDVLIDLDKQKVITIEPSVGD